MHFSQRAVKCRCDEGGKGLSLVSEYSYSDDDKDSVQRGKEDLAVICHARVEQTEKLHLISIQQEVKSAASVFNNER